MIEHVVRHTLGRRLAQVGGTYHIGKGGLSTEPLCIWLTFEGVPPYRFAGTSDGWHLVVDHEAPKEIDMQDAGVIRFLDMSAAPIFCHAMAQPVRKVWLVVSPTEEDVIGIRFDFEAATLRVLNWGDSMYVGSAFPSDADSRDIAERPIK